jgi:hypothetical protein
MVEERSNLIADALIDEHEVERDIRGRGMGSVDFLGTLDAHGELAVGDLVGL